MPFKDFATYREINSQTEAWAETLEVVSASRLPAMGAFDQGSWKNPKCHGQV